MSMHTVSGSLTSETVTVSGVCPVTKKPWTLEVSRAAYFEWRHGSLLQNALPGLSREQREMLQSGTSPEGWAILFPPTIDCPACKGTGVMDARVFVHCVTCGGRGEFTYNEAAEKIAALCGCKWKVGHDSRCPATALYLALLDAAVTGQEAT